MRGIRAIQHLLEYSLLGFSSGGAYALIAALAGLAGAVLALQSGTMGGQRFGEGCAYSDSLALLSMTVLAGAGFIVGALLTGVFAPCGFSPSPSPSAAVSMTG